MRSIRRKLMSTDVSATTILDCIRPLLLLPAGHLGEFDQFTGRYLELACEFAKPPLRNFLAAVCLDSEPCELTSQLLVAFAVWKFFLVPPLELQQPHESLAGILLFNQDGGLRRSKVSKTLQAPNSRFITDSKMPSHVSDILIGDRL